MVNWKRFEKFCVGFDKEINKEIKKYVYFFFILYNYKRND